MKNTRRKVIHTENELHKAEKDHNRGKAQVANVNKYDDRSRSKSREPKQKEIATEGHADAKIRKAKAGKIVNSVPEEQEVTAYDSLLAKTRSNQKRRANEQETMAAVPAMETGMEAQFQEDDQLMSFNVDTDDNFGQSDGEIESGDQLESDNDQGIDQEEYMNMPEEVVQDEQPHSSSNPPANIVMQEDQSVNAWKRKLQQLEEEMKQKMIDDQETEISFNNLIQDKRMKMSNPKRHTEGEGKIKDKNNNYAVTVDAILDQARSETTIYKNAVEKRHSSSPEEEMQLETSNESLNNTIDGMFIADKFPRRRRNDEPRPITGPEKTDQIIKNAELAEAKIFPPKGRNQNIQGEFNRSEFEFVARIDQDYLSVGSHVDQNKQEKIKRVNMWTFLNCYQKTGSRLKRMVGWNL